MLGPAVLGVAAALAAPSVLEARKIMNFCSCGALKTYTTLRDPETGEGRWIDADQNLWPAEFGWFPRNFFTVSGIVGD
ncbi:MAG TPA: hypothetical protein VFF73_05860 [Planctomycetota bacterium]|nr:hypothetical protein [Planctomycetota bacterium]